MMGTVLLAFVGLGVGLTGVALYFKNQAIILGAVMAWILLGIYGYTQSVATWDVWYGVFWFGMGMALITALLAMAIWKGKGEDEEPEQDSMDRVLEKQEKFRERQERWNDAVSGKRRER